MKAIGMYWVLVELCAEKMIKNKEEEYTEEHCRFEFDARYLRDTLGLHQTSTVSMYLRCYADVGLMSVECSDDVCSIYMPKLLECMDRDAKRARAERDPAAPKRKSKRKKEETVEILSGQQLLEIFDPETKSTWPALYPEPGFVERGAVECVEHYRDSPKCPTTARGWKQAFRSWLKRGWKWGESDRKLIGVVPAGSMRGA